MAESHLRSTCIYLGSGWMRFHPFTWDFIEVFFFFLFTLSGIWVSSSRNTLPLSVDLIHSLAIGVVRKITGITHQMPLAKGGDWISITTPRLVNVHVNI